MPITIPTLVRLFGLLLEYVLTMVPDGSYYYSNGNGSTYHNNGNGGSTYTAPNGNVYKK